MAKSDIDSQQLQLHPLDAKVSYGTDITKPARLETRTVADVLLGTRDGEWAVPVITARVMESVWPGSSVAKESKEAVPYVTWSGEFARRDERHLVQHSGLLGIDLDRLEPDDTRRIMHVALDDPHCLAAYRSVRGQGMRLLIRVPTVDAAKHRIIFDAAAAYVRKRYQVEPDAGADVARASFASWDWQMILNGGATVLPVPSVNTVVTTVLSRRNVLPGRRPETPWYIWLARDHVPHRSKEDGTAFTNGTLLHLAKALALRAERENVALREDMIFAIAREWFKETRCAGFALRRTVEEYAEELVKILRATRRCSWFESAAGKWTRWTKEKAFPESPKERLIYAIRRHCCNAGSIKFFLSARDAGTITGTSHVHASKLLKELVQEGRIEMTSPPNKQPRKAFDYQLRK